MWVTCMSCDHHATSTTTEVLTVDLQEVVGASAGKEVGSVLHGSFSNGDQLQLLIQKCNISCGGTGGGVAYSVGTGRVVYSVGGREGSVQCGGQGG